MILVQIFFFIIFSSVSILSIAGLGQLINTNKKNEFINNFFFGLIVLSFLITLLHFFVKISLIVTIFILISGLLIISKNFLTNKIKLNDDYILYFIIFLILIPLYISQKYHEDFGYYHLPYVINVINEKIIFGLANINNAFVHNSLWLNILPFFYIEDNFNLIMTPTFLIYIMFIIFSVHQIIKRQDQKISSFFLTVATFYLILKFTRLSEFGNDIPSMIFSSLAIYYFFRFLEEIDFKKKKDYFFKNLSFSLFAILIKFSSIPVVILTIYLFFKNYKFLIKEIFHYNYIIIYILCIMFFAQQFIYTGCFIFPSNLSCFDVSWFDQNFLNSKHKLELINKSYFVTARDILTEKEYLNDFNWVSYWFKKNFIEISEHLGTMIIPVLIYIFFLKKENNQNLINYKKLSFFYFFVLVSFVFWLEFSPVYRFGITYFISIVFLLGYFFYVKKIFSRKVFFNLIFIFLFFNLAKNLERLSNENDIFVGIKKIKNLSIPNTYYGKNTIQIFQPDLASNAKKGNGWQGRLCWDIDFICTKNKVAIKKINSYLFVKKIEN
ncbi:hypothetical protein N9V11_02895 [Candidatus Pelagibacter sp.]|nr:hypothetical protein [Candidatus Pelagibacter sp.]